MHILFVIHKTLPHRGGIQMVTFEQARLMVKMGHKVTILSSKIANEEISEWIDGIKIVRIPAENIIERKFRIPYPIFSPLLICKAKELIKSCDIVNVHGMLYISTVIASLLAKYYNKPLVITEHVGFIDTGNNFFNFIENIAVMTIGKLSMKLSSEITVCNTMVGIFLHKKNILSDNVEFIPNGVDTDFFYPVSIDKKKELRTKYGLPQSKPIVLFVGRLSGKKGIDICLKIVSPDYQLVLVGEGDINLYAKSLSPYISYLGPKNRSCVRDIMQASDIFILPSHGEGFPLVILEAMACGLPIITSDHPGYDDYLDRNLTKLIEISPSKFKAEIKNVLETPFIYSEMSNYSRKVVVEKYSWEHNVKKYMNLYLKNSLT